MYNTDLPNRADLPGTAQLLRSTLIAAAAAAFLLTVVILPAEYAVDPTGIGRALGLTQMGDIKRQLALENDRLAEQEKAVISEDASSPNQAPAAPATVAETAQARIPESAGDAVTTATRTDTTVITLKPGEATEIKLKMAKDATVTYAWSVDGGVVNYDTHADNESIDYHGYGKGKAVNADKGELKAAFDGHHGWFWRNRDKNTVTVTLVTSGSYTDIKKAN
jgi:hypothetical protein